MAIDHPYDALPPGYRLGGYEVLRVLGRGGFGFTYQARRLGASGSMVAIKELFPTLTAARAANQQVVAQPGADPLDVGTSIEMFTREAQVICSLDHPNIVQGLEVLQANGTAYLVMRYVTGRNLRESLRDPRGFRPSPTTLPPRIAVLLDALETLHRNGLLHCDIKPDNIFLGIDFEPILIDLGSARWQGPTEGIGEPSTYSHYFSAIEQVTDRFGDIGPWTDIYQLSAVLYRCIAGGKLPDAMDRLDPAGDPYVPLAEIPEAAAFPEALIRAVDEGLHLLPQHRPRSVARWRGRMGNAVPKIRKAPRQAKRTSIPPPDSSPRKAEPLHATGTPPALPTQSSDPLLWVAGALLTLILVVVFLLVW